MSEPRPSIGRTVHYTAAGDVGCRAAIVTDVWYSDKAMTEPTGDTGLCVLNSNGMQFVESSAFSAGGETPGDPNCPNPHGDGPFRYCACGWIEAGHKSGTWHWPERV